MVMVGELTFDAPGPGTWTADGAHNPRPSTSYFSEVVSTAFAAGFSETLERYGVLIDRLVRAKVHGFSYGSVRWCEGAAVERRMAASAAAFDQRLWRHDVERWDTEVKPATVQAHRALAAVELGSLDVDGLVAHLVRCREHHCEMITQHHRFNGACMIPTGDLLAHASRWTGLPARELLDLLRGSSPESCGGGPEASALADAIAGQPQLSALVHDPATEAAGVLGALQSDPHTAAAYAEWTGTVGYRIAEGFDVTSPTLQEYPAMLVRCLRFLLADSGERAPEAGSDSDAVRALVPPEHREEFDRLLDEALLTYRLRDERGVYSDISAAGLSRLGMLEAGRRLFAVGRVHAPEDALDATTDELIALLTGNGGPGADELRDRGAFRQAYSVADIPPVLGDPPGPPPDYSHLPFPGRRSTEAMLAFMGQMWSAPPAESGDTSTVTGIGASAGVHRGRARIVRSVDDVFLLEDGDVLVAMTTSEAFGMGLAAASAIVTDHGGLLSHPAIIAREYGIPAVVGTGDATARIPDGAVIEVDGTAGEVRILS